MGCPPMSESVHFHRGYSLRLHKSKPFINYGIISGCLHDMLCVVSVARLSEKRKGGDSLSRMQGCAPAGKVRRSVWETAVTWALACARFACGYRKTLVIEAPLRVVDSMCSILSIVVVRARSKTVVNRSSISCGLRPVYCQAMAITGISIVGKMSVVVRSIMMGLRRKMSRARTIKV